MLKFPVEMNGNWKVLAWVRVCLTRGMNWMWFLVGRQGWSQWECFTVVYKALFGRLPLKAVHESHLVQKMEARLPTEAAWRDCIMCVFKKSKWLPVGFLEAVSLPTYMLEDTETHTHKMETLVHVHSCIWTDGYNTEGLLRSGTPVMRSKWFAAW